MTSRLLIAEDDAQLRDVLVRALRAEGFRRAPWAPGASCSSAAGPDPPDALVVDVGLPDADGRDVCQALRSRGVWTPVLFLTARDALTDRLAGFRAGGDDYVTKPFDLDEVLERLHALLRRGAAPAADATRSRRPAPALQLDPAAHAALGDGHVAPHADRVPPARRARGRGRARSPRQALVAAPGRTARSSTTTRSTCTSRACAASCAACPARRRS